MTPKKSVLRDRYDRVLKGRDAAYRSFGRRRYGYAGAAKPGHAREYQRKWGKDWYIRLVPIKDKGKIVGYHIWLGGTK